MSLNFVKYIIYGLSSEDLSYNQRMVARLFSERVEPWLNENLGRFGEEWFVEIDKEHDSLRLQFNDIETETWFKLAWIHGAKEEEEFKY